MTISQIVIKFYSAYGTLFSKFGKQIYSQNIVVALIKYDILSFIFKKKLNSNIFVNQCGDYLSIVTIIGCFLPLSKYQNWQRPLNKTVIILLYFI